MVWGEIISQIVWSWTGCSDDRAEATGLAITDGLLAMPPADRIAMARELLAGTWCVVAVKHERQPHRHEYAGPGPQITLYEDTP